MSRSNLKENCSGQTDVKDLENIMVCAKWIVGQFEDLNCISLANVFQCAVDDAEAWINNMVINSKVPKEVNDQPLCKEAEMIRKLLMKYASISDPNIRQGLIEDMTTLTKKKTH